jgi:hypothetical protein
LGICKRQNEKINIVKKKAETYDIMVIKDPKIHTSTHESPPAPHTHTYKHKQKQKLLQREKMGWGELLASIMVKQYNKHCVVNRDHINSEKGSRL